MTRKPIISGVYDTKVGKLPGSSVMSLHAEAAQRGRMNFRFGRKGWLSPK